MFRYLGKNSFKDGKSPTFKEVKRLVTRPFCPECEGEMAYSPPAWWVDGEYICQCGCRCVVLDSALN